MSDPILEAQARRLKARLQVRREWENLDHLRLARSYGEYVDDKKSRGERPLPKGEWESLHSPSEDKPKAKGLKSGPKGSRVKALLSKANGVMSKAWHASSKKVQTFLSDPVERKKMTKEMGAAIRKAAPRASKAMWAGFRGEVKAILIDTPVILASAAGLTSSVKVSRINKKGERKEVWISTTLLEKGDDGEFKDTGTIKLKGKDPDGHSREADKFEIIKGKDGKAQTQKKARMLTKSEVHTLYGVGVYAAGTALAFSGATPLVAAGAAAKAFGHSITLHATFKAVHTIADELFLGVEAVESAGMAGGLNAALGTGDIPGLNHLLDAISSVASVATKMGAEEEPSTEEEKFLHDLMKKIYAEAGKIYENLSDEDIDAVMKHGILAGGKTAKTFELNVGDPLFTGKYLNSPGRIEEFSQNDKGDPTVVVRKPPKGDKGSGTKKEVKVFKLRFDEEQAKRDEEQKKTADMTEQASHALMKMLSEIARRAGAAKHIYVVGGAVRNFVIQQPIKDIDVVIDSLALGKDSEWFANVVAKAIPARTSVMTDQYGVSKVFVQSPWELAGHEMMDPAQAAVEIANARSESYGGDAGKGYKPDNVEPATIEQDVTRREFTFNTLMWSLLELAKGPDKAEIIDLTGCGLKDLKDRRMQCPADPDKTFSDDPSRMLRAVKFIVKYGMKLTPDTEAAIKRNLRKLRGAPYEKIAEILEGTLLKDGATAKKALPVMKRLGLLDVISDWIRADKAFRARMTKWVNNKPMLFLFDLMDLGVPLASNVSFLDRAQQTRLRAVALGMPEGQPEKYLEVLRQPGKSMDTAALIQEFGLQGRAISEMQRGLGVRLLLEDPDLASNTRKFTEAVRKNLQRGVKTALWKPPAGLKGWTPMPRLHEGKDALESPSKWTRVVDEGGSYVIYLRQPNGRWKVSVGYDSIEESAEEAAYLEEHQARLADKAWKSEGPFAGKLTLKRKSTGQTLDVALFAGNKKMGTLQALKISRADKRCAPAIASLKAEHPETENIEQAVMVTWSELDESLRGKSAGTAMYQALMAVAFETMGPFFFMADSCGKSTSSSALKVWKALGRRYPFAGNVVAVVKKPTWDRSIKVAGGLKVYLDDERQTPSGWKRVYWPDEAIKLLKTGKVSVISLDHDLGDDRRGTGNDVVLWIEEQVATKGFVPPEIRVHSANSSARAKMEQGIRQIKRLYERFGGRTAGSPLVQLNIDVAGEKVEKIIPSGSLPYLIDNLQVRRVAAAYVGRVASRRVAKDPQLALKYTSSLGELVGKLRYNEQRDLGDTADLWVIWREFYKIGTAWADYLIDNAAIPRRDAKAVEMAARVFRVRYGFGKGPKPSIAAWFSKHDKRFRLLFKAADWEDRSEDDGIFKHGPFTVHNTVGASEKEVQGVKSIIDRAMRAIQKTELSGMQQAATGTLVLVGQIKRKNWAAWYMPSKDVIYLRPKNRGMNPDAITLHLVHEVCHRFSRKKLGGDIKQAWAQYHANMSVPDFSAGKLPEPGTVLSDVLKVNNKQVKVDSYDEMGRAVLLDAKTNQPIGAVDRTKLRDWIVQVTHVGKFPSIYSASDAEEHFCEAVAHKGMGSLKPDNLKAFNEIVLGQGGTENVRLAAATDRLRGRPRYAAMLDEVGSWGSSGPLVSRPAYGEVTAARYQNKKEVPKAKGTGTTTVYEYSEGQVEHRNREKAKRIEKLRGSIDKLRSDVTKDLKSKNETTRLVALAVGLMDHTYERVGNDGSAKDGHFGVTGWQRKHVTFSGSTATIKYVGKSGVSQTKTVTDKALVSAMKASCEGSEDADCVTGSVSAGDVNKYLKAHDITAKDIRGYHANTEVKTRLKAIRAKGGTLPSDPKEKAKKLKKEFEQALEEAAKAVGHKATTLKSQYLVPGMEKNYLQSGKVVENLAKQGSLERISVIPIHRTAKLKGVLKRLLQRADEALAVFGWGQAEMDGVKDDPADQYGGGELGYVWRVGQQWWSMTPEENRAIKRYSQQDAVNALRHGWRAATKSKGEKEDEEVRRLSRPVPTKKPPRKDLRRERMKNEDNDSGKATAENDKDLSLNYKKVARRFHAEVLRELGDLDLMRLAGKVDKDEPKKGPGDYWEAKGGWRAWAPKADASTNADSEEAAAAIAEGSSGPADDEEGGGSKGKGDEGGKAPKKQVDPKEQKAKEREKHRKDLRKQGEQFEKSFDAITNSLDEGMGLLVLEGFPDKGSKEFTAMAEAFADQLDVLSEVYIDDDRGLNREAMDDASEIFALFQPPEEPEEEKSTDEGGEDKPKDKDSEVKAEAARNAARKQKLREFSEAGPEDKAKLLARMHFAQRVVGNPAVVGGRALNGRTEPEELKERGSESARQFNKASAEIRGHAAKQAAADLKGMAEDDPNRAEAEAILDGLAIAAAANGESLEVDGEMVRPRMSEGHQVLCKHLLKAGKEDILLGSFDDFYGPAGREAVGTAIGTMDDKELVSFGKSGHFGELAKKLTDPKIGEEQKAFIREFLKRQGVEDLTTTQALVEAVAAENGDPSEANSTETLAKWNNFVGEHPQNEDWQKKITAAIDTGDADSIAAADAEYQRWLSKIRLDWLKSMNVDLPPDHPEVARHRHVVETGETSLLGQSLVQQGSKTGSQTI